MSFCFVDTETTGVHPDRQVWEVAMIRDEPHFGETSFFVEVDLSNADPFGLNVGRFYERHPYGRYLAGLGSNPESRAINEPGPRVVSEGRAAEIVARWTHGAHLVGAVPDFDARTLDPLLRKHRLIPAWHHRLICVESLTCGHLGRYVGGLAKCSAALGVEFRAEEEHTALGDARVAKAIWDKVVVWETA